MECSAHYLGPCDSGPRDFRCGACGAVRYCSRAHQNAHWNEHRGDCERLAEQMEKGGLYNDFPFPWAEEATWPAVSVPAHFWNVGGSMGKASGELNAAGTGEPAEWLLPPHLCPCLGPSNSLSTPLTSWSEYYTWRGLALDSPVALLLHWPLTLYYALSLGLPEFVWTSARSTSLRILYLGPEKELEELCVFGELLALLAGADIHVDLVGPAIPRERDGQVLKVRGYPKCEDGDCRCKGEQASANNHDTGPLVFKLWSGMYHDRHPELCQGSQPHIILAANAGIAVFSSWQPSIKLILESGVPAFFTDYCEEAGFVAEQCMRKLHGTALSFPVQLNPFRQPFAISNQGLAVPTYSNCVIFGIN